MNQDYYLVTKDYVSTDIFDGEEVLKVAPYGLQLLARQAFHDVSFMLRPRHNEMVAQILNDPKASRNDKQVALMMLLNADVASGGQLPLCQDTGTAIVIAQKGQNVWIEKTEDGARISDEEAIQKGILDTYTTDNLRYSQVLPLDMYTEKNSETNLPAQIDISATEGDRYHFLFIAKGGGSANKTSLFQENKSILTPERLEPFLIAKLKEIGTSACPPYHIAIVVGGTSAELNLKTVKLASAGYYDDLPTEGDEIGRAFRDIALEQKLLQATREFGIGAQFGGRYFAHDVRVIRLARHGASCPIGIGVSCSADRNIKGRIDKDGIWLEKLDANPIRLVPEELRCAKSEGVHIDLNRPMKEILAELSQHPVSTFLLMSGTIIVCRDIAHSRLKERLDRGDGLPDYIKNHPIYYAGPAKRPDGMASGSFGPTTAGRMDGYVDLFQENGGSLIMIAKGNRSRQVSNACKKYGGFYLGSVGGPAALLAKDNIKKVELLEYPELGMEAIWKIEVVDFPAFILIDDKGNDFYLDSNSLKLSE